MTNPNDLEINSMHLNILIIIKGEKSGSDCLQEVEECKKYFKSNPYFNGVELNIIFVDCRNDFSNLENKLTQLSTLAVIMVDEPISFNEWDKIKEIVKEQRLKCGTFTTVDLQGEGRLLLTLRIMEGILRNEVEGYRKETFQVI